LNVLFAICGLIITGAAAFYLIKYQDIDVILSRKLLWTVGAAGLGVFLISLWGCLAARSQRKCMLMVYSLLVLGAILVQLIGGVVVLNYANGLDAKNGAIQSLDEDVQKFVTCSYEICCIQNTTSCDNGFWNGEGFCHLLPDDLEGDTCLYKNDEPGFNDRVVSWLKANQKLIAIVVLSFCAAQFFALVFSCCLIFAPKREKRNVEDDHTTVLIYAEQPQQATTSGGAIMYGSAPRQL
jgi:hypothetical protein